MKMSYFQDSAQKWVFRDPLWFTRIKIGKPLKILGIQEWTNSDSMVLGISIDEKFFDQFKSRGARLGELGIPHGLNGLVSHILINFNRIG